MVGGPAGNETGRRGVHGGGAAQAEQYRLTGWRARGWTTANSDATRWSDACSAYTVSTPGRCGPSLRRTLTNYAGYVTLRVGGRAWHKHRTVFHVSRAAFEFWREKCSVWARGKGKRKKSCRGPIESCEAAIICRVTAPGYCLLQYGGRLFTAETSAAGLACLFQQQLWLLGAALKVQRKPLHHLPSSTLPPLHAPLAEPPGPRLILTLPPPPSRPESACYTSSPSPLSATLLHLVPSSSVDRHSPCGPDPPSTCNPSLPPVQPPAYLHP